MAVPGGRPCTGRCYCGRVRFAVDLDLIAACKTEVVNAFCHCFDCRRAHAAPLYEVSYVPAACFTITDGAELVNRNMGVRAFCANCGSDLIGDFEGNLNVTVAIGSLDHPEDWPMDQDGWWGHVHVADKVPWEVIGDGLPQDESYDRSKHVD